MEDEGREERIKSTPTARLLKPEEEFEPGL